MQSDALTFHIVFEWKNLAQEAEYLKSALDLSRDASLPTTHRHLDVIVLMGMASSLEKCYSGMERILKILAENLDDYVPKGDTWHKSLIDQMASKVGQRNPVISGGTAQGLHELRAFRHRERNSYSLDLDKARVMELGEHVFVIMDSLKCDLLDNLLIAEMEESVSEAALPERAATSMERAFHNGMLPQPGEGTIIGTVRTLAKDANANAFALVEDADSKAFAVPVSDADRDRLIIGEFATFQAMTDGRHYMLATDTSPSKPFHRKPRSSTSEPD